MLVASLKTPNLRQVIIPTPLQAIGSLVVALTIIIGVYKEAFLQKLVTTLGVTPESLQLVVGGWADQAGHINLLDHAPIIVFWFLVGIALYFAHYLLSGAFIEAYNLAVVETSYNTKPSATDLLKFAAPKLIMALILVAEFVISLQVLSGVWDGWLSRWILSDMSLGTAGWAVLGWLGLACNLYLLWITFEVMHNS